MGSQPKAFSLWQSPHQHGRAPPLEIPAMRKDRVPLGGAPKAAPNCVCFVGGCKEFCGGRSARMKSPCGLPQDLIHVGSCFTQKYQTTCRFLSSGLSTLFTVVSSVQNAKLAIFPARHCLSISAYPLEIEHTNDTTTPSDEGHAICNARRLERVVGSPRESPGRTGCRRQARPKNSLPHPRFDFPAAEESCPRLCR